GLDQVDEHQPTIELVEQLARARERPGVGRARMGTFDPDAGEQVGDLADAMGRHARVEELLEVASRRWSHREVTPPLGALERARRAGERARDHTSDAMLARHRGPG